jgi:hypothetical protein
VLKRLPQRIFYKERCYPYFNTFLLYLLVKAHKGNNGTSWFA